MKMDACVSPKASTMKIHEKWFFVKKVSAFVIFLVDFTQIIVKIMLLHLFTCTPHLQAFDRFNFNFEYFKVRPDEKSLCSFPMKGSPEKFRPNEKSPSSFPMKGSPEKVRPDENSLSSSALRYSANLPEDKSRRYRKKNRRYPSESYTM